MCSIKTQIHDNMNTFKEVLKFILFLLPENIDIKTNYQE